MRSTAATSTPTPRTASSATPDPGSPASSSCDEVYRLHRVLDRYAGARPSRVQQADIIRLLLLTGCRKSEIVTMRWQDVDHRHAQSERCQDRTETGVPECAGPRPSWSASRDRAAPSSFPRRSIRRGRCRLTCRSGTWCAGKPGIEDVRIHDLRHMYASHAVLQGIPLPVVSRLLGHKCPSMTLRYAHVGDRETEAAAERIGAAIARDLGVRKVSSNG